MAYTIQYAGICLNGLVRSVNEDNLLCVHDYLPIAHANMKEPFTGKISTYQHPAFAVFDGMGGLKEGETASFLAAKVMEEGRTIGDDYAQKANQTICRHADHHRVYYMGTTAAGIQFHPEAMDIMNIGDSRIYRYDGSELKCLSMDDTPKYCPQGNQITQFLGIHDADGTCAAHVTTQKYREKELYFLCTDGVTTLIGDQRIEKILEDTGSRLEDTLMYFKEILYRRGAPDNITMILCKVEYSAI